MLACYADDGRMRNNGDACRAHDDGAINVTMNRGFVDSARQCRTHLNRPFNHVIDRAADVRDAPRRSNNDLANDRPRPRSGNNFA